ncbi:MAG: hypothetical protein OEW48_02780 [Phycisphaerae bacterium]|nr:hypothetical protein [Phycisphaerae bacterium]
MITAQLMTTVFNAIILGFPALTPQQRWRSASDPFSTGFITERWFLLTLATVGIILCVLLLVVSRNRTAQQRRMVIQLFDEYADKIGLNARERQLLLSIATKAGLKQSETIFTTSSAFERGAAIITEESIARKQTTSQIEQLKAELFFLREKLGFQRRTPVSIGLSTKPKRLNSRQIPTGKKIYMVRRTSHTPETIESTVIENNDVELMVQLTKPVTIIFGEVWCARYYFGASVWEFDTSVISCNGDKLVLNHSDELRFVNRRRFLRVPVNKPAFVAHFPFSRTAVSPGSKSMKSFRIYRNSTSPSDSSWGPPEFIPAVVTELAGPGLCIEASLKLQVGDRVLVVFKLDEEENQDSTRQKLEGVKTATPKIVEDIGEVRHIKAIQNGFSIAVELIGLSDTDVSELIRATNAASLRTMPESQDVRASENVKEGAAEPAVAQGV